MQNHGSDAYSVRKKFDYGLNMSQTTHEANNLFLFVGMHFRIFVSKFIIHPPKLAQLL